MFTVQANVAGRDLGSVAREVQARLKGSPAPGGMNSWWPVLRRAAEGLSRAGCFHRAGPWFWVYMVLACQYESLRDPLVVMFSVPLAAQGVLITLFITRTTLNVQSYIGCIMLGGIVVNNAVLLVDQAGQLVRTGMSSRDALIEAGRRRLRPILMTTLTTILGLLPLALASVRGLTPRPLWLVRLWVVLRDRR